MCTLDSYMAETALASDPITATRACHCAATDVVERCSLGHDDRADCTKFWVDIGAKNPIDQRTKDGLAIGTMGASGSSGLGRLTLALLPHKAGRLVPCASSSNAGICPKFWPSQKAQKP